ncbi:teichuronic acid biosynthesis protein TuaG [Terrilactibacillus laevilacticus]|uniref:teichuronic acid biosynthesis protein TuaG n=1 Tax=Terrilactibacillus laevilacticus TaxID=1380157 RepID=UPI00114645BD|nr:glycosyltransferase family 2 protein [Terrilactibacillus laevilacticus]
MDRTQPLISIITPSFNAIRTIDETVDSVKKQTYQNWELVIIDDCSTDGTREKLKMMSASDKRIRVIFLDVNGGAAVARNVGLDHAKGRYIAFLDSDDRWKQDKLDKQIQFMQKHQYAFTFTGYEYMTHNGQSMNKVIQAPQKVTYHHMLKNTIVGCLTVMIDRKQTGMFKMPNIRTRQDLATWLMILKQGVTAYGLNENLAEYRIGNSSSISKNKWKAAKQTWLVYREIEKLNRIKASWCFAHYAMHAVLKRL